MIWKFWKKGEQGQEKKEKLPGPKELPDPIGRELVTKFGKNPDWVWRLKCVLLPKPEEKTRFDFRVFSEAEAGAKKVNVKNYLTLDEHPELNLFEGWYDKKSLQTNIEEKKRPSQEKIS